MTCDEVRAQINALLVDIDETQADLSNARAEIIDDPSNKKFWQAEVTRLTAQLHTQQNQLNAIRAEFASLCTNLSSISITFTTLNDNKDSDTVLHVFVRNRATNNTSTPVRQHDFIANLLGWQRHADLGTSEINPYLGFGESLGQGVEFADGSSHTFTIPLRGTVIPLTEVVLPVVDIHILPNGNDRWMFSYVVTFTFDDGRSFPATSDVDGITGIVLDQDNRTYSGICVENPLTTLPPRYIPQTDAVLTRVALDFFTHHDNKDPDTQVNLHLVNRLGATSNADIAVALDVLHGTEFQEQSTHTVVFGPGGLPLASPPLAMRDAVLPVVYVNIAPNGNDRWILDYRVTYTFSNGHSFESRTTGAILDQNHHKHRGVYQGDPFPSVTPPGKPHLDSAPIHAPKHISLSYLQRKLDQFVNNRQGLGSQLPPIRALRLHNTGAFGPTLPESYYDIRSIEASPPLPGTITPPDYREAVTYTSSPTSLGQLTGTLGIGDLYLNNINSSALTARIDATPVTPLTLEVIFDCSGSRETIAGSGGVGQVGTMDFTSFILRLALTLKVDPDRARVDLMSWAPDIQGLQFVPIAGSNQGYLVGEFLGEDIDVVLPVNSKDAYISEQFIGRVIDVKVVTTNSSDPGGVFQIRARNQIFQTLTTPDPFDGTTPRDRINSQVNSWLLGGVLASESPTGNGCRVQDLTIDGDTLTLTYSGPSLAFVSQPPTNWPAQFDLSPGNLANIDHIVVLMMENRSFDHMLGYLSLPSEKGGMGRADVDGLKGGEVNIANGVSCPSFPLPAGDTIFAPDPPHGYEPVVRAINGGHMDGFAQAYAEDRGMGVASRIMGYHTAANVPTYDALARDFAVGHRWFASHPGPTFCNRFYQTTGRLNIDPDGFWEYDNSSPLRPVFTRTIFDELSDRGVSWRYFEHEYCFLRFFEKYTCDPTNVVAFDDPGLGFVNLARNGALPSVSFIDPHYIELPPAANCDGPPADVAQGQRFVQQVVDAVVSSPAWSKTLLLIIYDEHGGFYDHVPPPAAAKVSPESLGTFGVRVPAFVITPWVKGGSVFGSAQGAPFDHTSVLKTIVRRFLHDTPPYLGARFLAANDLTAVIGNTPQPGPFRPFIPYNFAYVESTMRLDVQGASTTPGAILQQFTPNSSNAQQFSFEDAGGGFFFIRTHTGSLYLTVDQSLRVTEQVKSVTNPNTQRWKFTSNAISINDLNKFSVSNATFPDKLLQPAGNSHASGVPVVLDAPESSGGIGAARNAWRVTSPLLPDGSVVSA